MKILILNYEYPPLGGGAGVIAMHQARELSKGNQVTVVTSSEKNQYEEIGESGMLKIVKLKVSRKEYYKSDYYEKIDWILKGYRYFKKQNKIDFDICIAHFSMPGGLLAFYLKKKFGLKYTIVSHGHDIPWFCRNQMFWVHLAFYPLIKLITKNSERLFVQSEEMFENARRFWPKGGKKIIKIPNGCEIPLEELKPFSKDGSGKLELLFVGRLTHQKQPFSLIEIALELKRKSIAFGITVAGDGPLLQPLLQEIKNNGLTKEFIVKGWVDKKQVFELYQQFDILLAPTIGEGMSIAIIEALSFGIFVLTNPVSGNPELIRHGETGFITDGSTPDFIRGIGHYLKEKQQIEKHKEENLLAFRNRYNWENIGNRYYKELLDVTG